MPRPCSASPSKLTGASLLFCLPALSTLRIHSTLLPVEDCEMSPRSAIVALPFAGPPRHRGRGDMRTIRFPSRPLAPQRSSTRTDLPAACQVPLASAESACLSGHPSRAPFHGFISPSQQASRHHLFSATSPPHVSQSNPMFEAFHSAPAARTTQRRIIYSLRLCIHGSTRQSMHQGILSGLSLMPHSSSVVAFNRSIAP